MNARKARPLWWQLWNSTNCAPNQNQAGGKPSGFPSLAKRAGQGLFCTALLSTIWHLSRETTDGTIWVSEQSHSSNHGKLPDFKCHGCGKVGGKRALYRAKHNSLIQKTTCPLSSPAVPQPNRKTCGQGKPYHCFSLHCWLTTCAAGNCPLRLFNFFPSSGLPEKLGQHNRSDSWCWSLLQVLLWEKVRPERLRIRARGRHTEHGQGRETRYQAWEVS